MHVFEVWAPEASRVEVKTGGQWRDLQPGRPREGWWSIEAATAQAGTDYCYRIDGEGPELPDPRSPWQPNGVHGPSRLLDHSAFVWSDRGWQAPPLAEALIYELHVGTFTPEGTFDAVAGKLDYLRELGVTHIELMPVAAWPGARGWGYDGVDLFAPHEAYGGPEGLKRLVDACHAKGLAVLLDVVYNHLGPDGNYLQRFGPYFTHAHATPWGDAVNLDQSYSHEVRRFFIDNALMWLRDYRIDGLRLDAVHAFADRSAIHFLEQLTSEVRELEAATGRHLVVIAESDLNDPRLVRPCEAGGFGMDAQWSDDFHHALFAVLTGERQGYYQDFGAIADLARALTEAYVYSGRYSRYRKRHHGRPAGSLPGWRFLGYAQNHDQVGNRARGERLAHLTTPGRARVAAALVLTSPFVPLLFQGEEFAASTPFLYFTGHEDPELGRAVSEGRKREFADFGWKPEEVPDPQAEETFLRSKLNWAEAGKEPHRSMLAWYRALVRLRRRTQALSNGRRDQVEVRFDEQAQWIVVHRGPIGVVCNLGTAGLERALPPESRLVLASDERIALRHGRLTVPPDAVAITQAG